MTSKLAGTLVGAALALMSGAASAQIYTLEVHSGDNAGRAYPGEDAYRNNNDQQGAGVEHLRCNLVGDSVMCVGTASYTDIPGSPVQNRLQTLCTSHRLDATAGLVQQGIRYITQNDGDEYQNGHVPTVTPVLGGEYAVVHYNYDPDNNTKLWAKVVDKNCNEMTGQTLILAKQNDNVLGQASNPVVVYDSANETRVAGCGIGNGNGRDDMWCYGVKVTKNGDQISVERYFDKSVEAEEERTRSPVVGTSMPDKIFECAAVGNNQPPDRGVRCSLVDTAPGTPDENRVVWRKYIQQREGNIYATTPAVAPLLNPDGSFSDTYIVTYVEVDTSNRRGREKGETNLKTVAVKVGPTDLEILETPQYNIAGFGDQAHQHMCAVRWGADAKPAVAIGTGVLSGSVTGGAEVVMVGFDPVTRRSQMIEDVLFGDNQDTGWVPQYYGNNPNTPQGRNHGFCMQLANPGYGVAGGFQSNVKEFIFAANTPRRLRADGSPEDKLAMELVLVPAVVPEEAEEPDPTPTDPPDDGEDPTDPSDPSPDDAGAQVGGCSTTGTSGGAGSLLLLGLAVGFVRRRRSSK